MTIAVQVQLLTSEPERQHGLGKKLESWQRTEKTMNSDNLRSLIKEIFTKV